MLVVKVTCGGEVVEILADFLSRLLTDRTQFSYCNINTGDNEVGQDIDSVRRMVLQLVVCVFETIVKDDRFLEVMEEGGR